jgi:hypothetical protein
MASAVDRGGHPGVGRPGVLDHVRQRLGEHEVGGRLDRGLEPRDRDVDVDRHGKVGHQAPHARVEAATGQRGR